jgi:hypothetical protein
MNNCQSAGGKSILDMALEYHRRGWSIIPIKPGTKKPTCKWTKYQTERATEEQLTKWFGNGQDVGLAVVFGYVSDGLVCRDFDDMAAYNVWAADHPELAKALPTAATVRGRHVYFISNYSGIKKLDDGELRGGGYCLLPPSRHPDGPEYHWLIPLPDGPLPVVENVQSAGFLGTHVTERTEENGENRGNDSVVSMSSPSSRSSAPSLLHASDDTIERVIIESLPTGIGKRNRHVFELARALKAVPTLADAPVDALEPYVRQWHNLGVARGVIGTEPFEETWIDFLVGWPKVKFPRGEEPMSKMFELAKQADMPKAALRYEQKGLRLLVLLCRELQRASGDKPFFLACRTAGKLLSITHVQAWRWLTLLAHDEIVKEVEKGDRLKRRASRYRCLVD